MPAGKRLGERLRNIVALGGANVLATAISILTVPLISRLYGPADYGALAVVATVASLIAPLTSLAYQDAIVIAGSKEEAASLTVLCLLAASVVATISAIVLLLAAPLLADWLNFTADRRLLAVAALNVLMSGFSGPISSLANRDQKYRLIAFSRLGSAISISVVSISLGYAHWGAAGLITATVVGSSVTLLTLLVGMWPASSGARAHVSMQSILAQASLHSNFPRYTLSTHFINAVTENLPRTLLAVMFGEAALGLFTRTSSLLSLPSQLVGAPVAEVFRRDLSQSARDGSDPVTLFRSTALQLAGLATVGVVLTLVCAPWLFPLVLGPKWQGTGELAQLLAPMYALRLVNAPLSFVVFLVRQHRFDLLMTILLLLLSLGSMTVAYTLHGTAETVLFTYSAVCTLTSCFMLYKNFQFAGQLRSVPHEI